MLIPKPPELNSERGDAPPPAGDELSLALREELLDPAAWEQGLEKYAVAMKLAVALTDAGGRLLGRCVNPRPTWSLVHRKQPPDVGACPFSLTPASPCTCVADALHQGTVVMARDRTGLVHFAVPLALGGYPLGALLAGQVFDHYPEQLPLEQVARRCGLAPDKVLQMACREHPVSQTTLRVYAELLATLGQAFLQTRYHTLLETRRLAELTRVQEQLRQAQKMETIGRLAGGVAHDFNNLLTPILGYCFLMQEELAPADPMRLRVQVIQECAQRAATVTRQLLAFSRKQILAPRVLDLNAVVLGIDAVVHTLLGANVEVVRVLEPDLGRVRADPGQLEQVILNLVANARDAMPQGGRLTIVTGNIDRDDLYTVTHPEVRAGRYAMLAVTDTGCGMDDQVQAHLFEPFYTTKKEGKGTGMGLASVYGIIAQSGGHLEVHSAAECGSTFAIYLPCVLGQVPVHEPPPRLPDPPRGRETVLLVEDEEAIRKMVRQVLQGNGYTVLQAENGREALQVIEQFPGTIHLLLTDVVMPLMGGLELAERLCRDRPDLKVLYVSGHTEEAVFHHGIPDAGAAFLQKPFQVNALVRKVRELLDHLVCG